MFDDLSEKTPKRKRDNILSRLREFKDRAATFSGSEIAQVQSSALNAYRRSPPRMKLGEEKSTGLSKFVSGDVSDAVDAVLPRILSMVEKQPRFVEFESESVETIDEAQQQGIAVESVIRDMQQESHRLISDFAKSGLLYRIAVGRIQPFTPPPTPFVATGLSIMAAMQIQNSPSIVNGKLSVEPTDPEKIASKEVFSVRGKRIETTKIIIENLAPEALLIPPYTETLNQSSNLGPPYVAIRSKVSYYHICEMFPDKKKQLKKEIGENGKKDNDPEAADPALTQTLMAGDDELLQSDERRLDRHDDEYQSEEWVKPITLMDEYLRHDLDGDGHAELLNIQRVGDFILRISEVPDNNLVWWSPFYIPNKLIGESLVDKVAEYQDLNTDLIRAGLDATALAINPRIAVDASRLMVSNIETGDTLQDLMSGGPGAIIQATGPPKDVLDTFTPDSTAASTAFSTVRMFKEWREERVGINPMNKEGASYQRTAAGMSIGMKVGNMFVGAIADNFAEGMKLIASKVRDALIMHDVPKMHVRSGDQFVDVDPTYWTGRPICRINVAGSMFDHQEKMTFLAMIYEYQSRIMEMLGPDNPLSGIREARSVLTEMTAVMGYRDPNRFFNSVSDEQIAQMVEKMSANDPAAQAAQAEMESRQMEMQMKQQEAQQQSQLEMVKIQQANELEQVKMQGDMRMKMMEMEMDMQMKMMEMAKSSDIKGMEARFDAMAEDRKTAMDALLEQRKQDIEETLEKRKQGIESKLASNAKIGSVRQGGKVG